MLGTTILTLLPELGEKFVELEPGDKAGQMVRVGADVADAPPSYAEAARAIRAARAGNEPDPEIVFPTVEDGLAGTKFIEAAVKSSAGNGAWVRVM